MLYFKQINRSSFKERLINLFIIVFFAITIVTTSGYALSTVYGNIFYILLFFSTILLLFIYFLKYLPENKFNLAHIAYLMLVFLSIISFIFNYETDYLTYVLKFIITITFSFLFTLLVSFKTFINYYIKVMKLIVIFSLIAYFLAIYLQIPLNLPIVENINGMKYYNGVIFFLFEGYIIDRNPGVFWEPGIFSTFITFALIFEIVMKEKSSKINILIFSLGIISTQSTSGYFMLFFVCLLLMSKYIRGIFSVFTIMISTILLIIGYLNLGKILSYLYLVNPRVFGKFVNNSNSLTDRISSPMRNLEIFKEFPIFGAGIGKSDILFSLKSLVTQTSTSTYFLASFGVLGVLYTLYWILGVLNLKQASFLSRILILTMILLQINKEPHIFFSATYIIMFYFIKLALIKKSKKSLKISFDAFSSEGWNKISNEK